VGRLKAAWVWCLGERDAARSFKNYGQMVECVRVDLDRRRTPPATVPRDIALQAGRVVSVSNAGACAAQHGGRFEGERLAAADGHKAELRGCETAKPNRERIYLLLRRRHAAALKAVTGASPRSSGQRRSPGAASAASPLIGSPGRREVPAPARVADDGL
jgi:hypothetical protein